MNDNMTSINLKQINPDTTLTLGGGELILSDTTESSSSTTGSIKTAGGMGIAKKLFIGTDLSVGGNVTAGTWQGSTITVQYGGTGATSLTTNGVLVGNGASAISVGAGISYTSSTLTLPKMVSNDTTNSTSGSTGAVQLSGGLGIAKDIYASGGIIGLDNGTSNIISFGAGTGSPAYTTRSAGTKVVLSSGITASTADYAIGVETNNVWFSTSNDTTGGFNWYHGTDNSVTLSPTQLYIKPTTASSSSTTGALRVAGGVGIAGNLYIGGNLVGTHSTLTGLSNDDHTQYALLAGRTGGQTITGGTASGNNITIRSTSNATKGAIVFDETTDSSSTSTGALQISGGVGIAKKLFIGTDVSIGGNITAGTWQGSTVGVAYGGTGATTFTANGVLIGNGTSAVSASSGITYATSTLTLPKITSNDSTATTSNSTGAVLLSGGLASSNTTDASSSTNGGTITTAGGVAIAKKLFVGGVGSFSNTIDMNSTKIINLATPTASGDAATMGYVDSVVQGLDIKQSVHVATITAQTLASDFENGDTIDNHVIETGQRILIKDQVDASENGIYVANASGAPTRASDLASASLAAGMFVFVEQGDTNADSGWVCTNNSGSDVVGTNDLAFSQFSSAGVIQAGTGLTKTVNTLSVNASQTQITSIGTISTGTWNGSTITVPYGGTGATSLTTNGVLVGNGTSAISTGSGISYTSSTLTLPKIISNDSTATTSNSTGSVLFSGGLGISNATDATSSTNGGTITTAGGLAVAKKAYIGTNLVVNSVDITPSSGDIKETSFSTTNDQSTAASVTGFVFSNGTVRSFRAIASVFIDATANLYAHFDLYGVQKESSWVMTTVYTGDNTNIIFTITSAGQIQYTSGNEAGFSSGVIKFRAWTTSV